MPDPNKRWKTPVRLLQLQEATCTCTKRPRRMVVGLVVHFLAGRSTPMPVDQKTREALDPKCLPDLPNLRVTRVEVEDYTDWEGEPALKVLVGAG